MNAPVSSASLAAEAALPVWNLGDLYASPRDPKIDADFQTAATQVAELMRLKGALVSARANPERLAEGARQRLATAVLRSAAALERRLHGRNPQNPP